MNNKLLLAFIQKKKNLNLANLYQNFQCNTPQCKKKIKEILVSLQEQGNISFDVKRSKIVSLQNLDKTVRKADKYSYDERKITYTEQPQEDLSLINQKHQLPQDFSPAVFAELQKEPWDLSLENHRKDFRKWFMITIDGADSKDLDDAVTLTKSFFGYWELGVHIADVSHYVPQHTALDEEALQRANSCYLINKVIPMLPKQLSNDLCSLNPHEEKKAMSIIIRFDNQGNLKGYQITPSLIKTSYRMTYDHVEEIIQGAEEKDKELKNTILRMNKLFRILHQKRMKNGSIDFNFREKKITLDEQDAPVKIYQKDRLDSERLIEEFMLAANQAAGDFLTKNGLGLYRVHAIPPSEKYERLRNFASKRGYKLPSVPTPKDLQDFINSLIGLPVQMAGEILTLRSMAQAVYQQDNIGHFGLGFELYAHFTSPIRRYADLVVHRLIKYYLFRSTPAPYTADQLDKIAEHISAQERVTLEAERDLYKIKSVRYMKAKQGETLKGKISSIAHFGLFLEEQESGIEAMIRYVDMPDYIYFNEDELTAYNRPKKIVYKIGMNVRFRIAKVNIEKAFIDADQLVIEEE
ncbi:MAG: ribonuclease R family protein [Brevinema sp.]